MAGDGRNRKPGHGLVETREEAMEAIASALDFLRREAATLGMHEVSEMIGRVRVRVRNDETVLSGDPHRH